MITFKQFLVDDQGLSNENALNVFKEKCSDWKDRDPLYRLSGDVSEPKIGYSRTRETRVRKSPSIAGTSEVQDWILSLPEWKGFPDRRKSVFCSTTRNFGLGDEDDMHLYMVYPFNGVNIAVTEATDFNFSGLGEHDDATIMGIEGKLRDTFKELWGKRADSTYSVREVWAAVVEKLEKIAEKRELDEYEEFLLHLEDALKPDKIASRETTKSFDSKWFKYTHEVWFEGKYLMIPSDLHDEFLEEL